MTPGKMLRPVLVCLAGLATASCGAVEGDPHRFETLAEKVADIRLDGSVPQAAPRPLSPPTEAGRGLAGVAGPSSRLRVEVMDPHDLWDARDGLRRTYQEESAAVTAAAAPVIAQATARALIQQVSTRVPQTDTLRPARAALKPTSSGPHAVIQLGAYASEAAARSAWTAARAGSARAALDGLSPTFEKVEVNGRTLTRLKVAAPAAAAAAICRAARVDDPWCARRT